MCKDYNARVQLLFRSLNLLFGDVLVAVMVVVCLSSRYYLPSRLPLLFTFKVAAVTYLQGCFYYSPSRLSLLGSLSKPRRRRQRKRF